jgi:hypothetical protein
LVRPHGLCPKALRFFGILLQGGKAMNPTTEPSRSYVRLAPGDPAPWFNQRSTSNPSYAFDTAAGRYIVLCFFASAGDPIL